MSTIEQGHLREDLASSWLEERGYRILRRNVNYKVGEIDIVAQDGKILVFVEVRSRSSAYFGTPQATVNRIKQGKLIRAAQLYLKFNYSTLPFCRFDVVAITGHGLNCHIEHFKNAFEVSHGR